MANYRKSTWTPVGRPPGGASSREKGAGAERELATILFDELGVKLVRRLDQSRAGGYDLDVAPAQSGPVVRALGRYALEVKRRARVTPADLAQWWAQSWQQASRAQLVPLLAYRADRAPWRIVLPLAEVRGGLARWQGVEYTAELSIAGFAAMIREGAGL